MDHTHEHEKEHTEKTTANTEYLPTKCRITKPPPPKPATNPLQFIKVAPCPLLRKAQEQIKKVEEIKTTRQHVREEAEDWQQNLDNWKSSRRKRQEHIIERVVEVKKLEQEEMERNRRKSKTFSEMIEERTKGRHKFNIPIYDDDSNDLSDYGIGSSSSKTNSIKDVDTDDSGSLLDEKDQGAFDSASSKDANLSSNYSQSEEESNTESNKMEKLSTKPEAFPSTYTSKLYTTFSNNKNSSNVKNDLYSYSMKNENEEKRPETEEYTYEGAIQDYRSRIKSKINVSESVFNKMQDYSRNNEKTEPQTVVPKGQIFKCKEIFELEKPLEINHFESNSSRRVSEDFANAQSVKERLQNFQKSAKQNSNNASNKNINQIGSVKSRLQNFNKTEDTKNNNNSLKPKPNLYTGSYITNKPDEKYQTYLDYGNRDEVSDRSSSPEAELYMNKLNMFNNDLDNLMFIKRPHSSENELDELGSNYPASVSSTEMLGTSSDREDSGIHTADVSCSVSQADEPVELSDLSSSTIPSCIEKLTIEKQKNSEENIKELADSKFSKEFLVRETEDLLNSLRKDASNNKIVVEPIKKPTIAPKPIIYENVEIKPFPANFIIDSEFPLAPPRVIEPPKAKPPPPPPPDTEDIHMKPVSMVKRNNSTKRIKKEINLKRSSFLGLEQPDDGPTDPELAVDRPPDVNSFLQKESKLEKSMYRRLQETGETNLSKVESQDSGLDIERGRLSSDTWCSSIGDSSHGRQDSEHTNSITSEEDEITKKEREIIAMVEKEEQSRDNYYSPTVDSQNQHKIESSSYFPDGKYQDEDSEVLKVKHELLQLEREQQERQRDNFLFGESRSKPRIQNNRHSLENICDNLSLFTDNINYRKSMPELQHVPKDYRKSIPDAPIAYKKRDPAMQYRKSMPDIQHAYFKSTAEYQKSVPENTIGLYANNRKSMPELKTEYQKSAFYSPAVNRQPIMPGKPIRPLAKDQRQRLDPDFAQHPSAKPLRPLTRQSGIPKVPSEGWIQQRQNPEVKNYNQHWLYQEAELRRISEQQAANSRNRQQQKQEKHIPDSVIKSLTQRVQNKTKSDNPNKDFPYMPHTQTLGHALPMSYPPMVNSEDSQDRVLSVSGKKKCSYCGNELGRGAAMIIESLCLFYHMECFKCCVCHMQLGDGLMGTDVRVRNQKLHCHNCYSSDDGVKFSCV